MSQAQKVFASTGTAPGGAIDTSALMFKNRAAGSIAAKTYQHFGCPPHPDWIVGTIAAFWTQISHMPSVNANYQPVDYGYREYQCNAGPCPWRYNNTPTRHNANSGTDNSCICSQSLMCNSRYPQGDSKTLGRNKWTGTTSDVSAYSAAKEERQRQTARAEDGMQTWQRIMVLTGV